MAAEAVDRPVVVMGRILERKVVLLVSPWLSYSCSVGARFLLRKPGESEGRCATVQRILADDRCAMRVDGESKETLLDPRPDTSTPQGSEKTPLS